MEFSESGSEHDNSNVVDSHVKSKSKSKRQKRKHFEMCDLSSSENSDIASYVKPKSKGKKVKRGSQRRVNQKVVVMKAVQTLVTVNLPHLIM